MKKTNTKPKIEKAKFLLIIPILFLLIGGVLAYQNITHKTTTTNKSSSPSTPTPAINITYQNIASQLSKNSMIKDLPDGSTLLLKFYNSSSAERQLEKSYLITTGKIVEGETVVDITLLLHSKYLTELTNKNFCAIIKKANQNGDLGVETNLSSTALAWKLKSMYQYKDCLG